MLLYELVQTCHKQSNDKMMTRNDFNQNNECFIKLG